MASRRPRLGFNPERKRATERKRAKGKGPKEKGQVNLLLGKPTTAKGLRRPPDFELENQAFG
jgi:hypothetical protein